MFGGSKKPYTAITVQIERLTSEQYDDNDFSGLIDLVEVVRLQGSGPTEAARAIRKKLKYGNVHRQLRALTILDGLIQNAGARFQKGFADEALLERLRVLATDPVTDPEVKARCQILFGQWAVAYKDTPGMGRVASLYKQLPQRKKPRPQQQSTALKESEPEGPGESRRPSVGGQNLPSSVMGPSSTNTGSDVAGSKPKKEKLRTKGFNLEKEKPQLLQVLASSSIASTNLMNGLKRINRETQRVSEDREVMTQFETCKMLRRQILRYIQHVESEQWLGGLIHANEELVNALMAFEVLDKSVEDDSDSDDDDDEWDAAAAAAPDSDEPRRRGSKQAEMRGSFAGLMLGADDRPARPPRPGSSKPTLTESSASNGKGKAKATVAVADEDEDDEVNEDEEEDDDDEDDPFADRNAI